MNAKWCVSTLIIILAVLGLSQEQTKASNQQILLQFTDVEKASKTAHEEVLAEITKKLKVLGVETIEIIENDEAQLSIRYYSDIDALSVKEFLSQENEFLLTHGDVDHLPSDFPKDQLPENYSLIVSDIQQQVDGGLNLNGKLAFEIKQDHNRFPNPITIQFNHTISFKEDFIADVAYKTNKAINIDNTSQAIPEVRAGPCV